MQYRNQSGNGVGSVASNHTRVLARYRVMTGSRQGSAGLVSLAESRSQAVALAARFRDNMLALRTGQAQPRRETEGLKSVYVEEWIGTLTSGRWVRLGPGRGGFFHSFSTRRGVRRVETPSTGLHSGARVACVLLEQRTRKGGWRAASWTAG